MKKFIKNYTTKIKDENGKAMGMLIWGDPVDVLEEQENRIKVKARIWDEGYVDKSDIGDEGLLEIYIIDVGQGDSVLMRTPDDKWHLIDAGVSNKSQMTKKGAANFLVWKFYRDLGRNKIELENLIMSHPDYDHYGGMIDLLSERLYDGRTFSVDVKNFYHSGMARFDSAPELGTGESGKVDPFPNGFKGISRTTKIITELLNDRSSFRNPPRKLKGSFKDLSELIAKKIPNCKRLSQTDKFLIGYDSTNPTLSIKILGPIEEKFNGHVGLRRLGGDSITRNGHSIVLRVDFDKVRILLTGDLNEKSQKLLLSYVAESEFEVDVAKSCHHGSEDIHMDFIKAMGAKATVISSGDNEDYAHPRPVVMGASAFYGRQINTIDDEILPPLIYSTELARSTKLDFVRRVRTDDHYYKPTEVDVKTSSNKYEDLERIPVATDLIYGLVNIRTDGKKILCATMEEKGRDFDVKVFKP